MLRMILLFKKYTVVIIFSISCISCTPNPNTDFSSILNELNLKIDSYNSDSFIAISKFKTSELDDMQSKYDNLLYQQPENIELLYSYALFLFYSGKNSEENAKKINLLINKILEINPNFISVENSKFPILKINIFFFKELLNIPIQAYDLDSKEYHDKIIVLDNIIKMQPCIADPYFEKIRLTEAEPTRALKFFDEMILKISEGECNIFFKYFRNTSTSTAELDKDKLKGYKSMVLLTEKMYEESINEAKEIESPTLRYRALDAIYSHLEMYNEQLLLAEEILNIIPNDPYIMKSKASAFYKLGEYDKSISVCNNILKLKLTLTKDLKSEVYDLIKLNNEKIREN